MCGVLDDCDDSLEFFRCDFTGTFDVSLVLLRVFRSLDVPFVEINIGLLADKVGVSSANTLDSGQGIHDLLLAIDVGVEETQDELKVRLLAADESC